MSPRKLLARKLRSRDLRFPSLRFVTLLNGATSSEGREWGLERQKCWFCCLEGPGVVYSSPCPIHLHYFDNTTAPLLILQDNNDPRRRPSPCGEGSVRYMRAFTKAAIAAVRSSSSSSSSSSGTSISSKSSSNRSITRNYSSSSAGNAEREQQRSTRSRPQL